MASRFFRKLWWLLTLLLLALPAQAAITPVAASSSATPTSGASALTVSVPAGTAQNDVMLAVVSVNLNGSATTITAPAGWTLVRSDNSGTIIRQSVYFRVASASEPASYAWTFSNSKRAVAGIVSYRGVDSLAPINASSGQANGSSGTITAPSLTTTAYNAMLAGFFGTSNGNGSIGTYSGGLAERFDQATGGGGPNGSTASAADAVQITQGASGSKTAVASVAAVNIGQLVALKPAAALLADYRFDECSYTGSGSEVLDTTGTYNAQAKNGLNTSSPGQINRYGDFSTYDKWAQTSIPIAGDWSLSAWFKTPFVSTQRYHIVASVAGGSDLLYLDRSNNFRWGVYTLSGTTDGTFRFGTLSNGWHHLALAGYNGRTYLYIDGAYVESVGRKASGTLTYLGTSFDAVNTASAQGFGAPLDEMRIYANALNTAEVASIYNNQLAGLNADGTVRPAVICPGAAPGGFNAYETSTLPATAITGVIKTKIAGQAFSFDIIALNTAKDAIQTSFTGTVRVELLNSSDNSGALDANGCRSTWTVIQSPASQTFAAGDAAITGTTGRHRVTGVIENNVWPDVRVRITYPETGAASAIGCSTDNFAIRPASLASFSVTDTDRTTAGTSRTLNSTGITAADILHNAGRPFTVRATAVNAAAAPAATTNYTGTPAAVLSACAGAACTATFGALSIGSSALAGVLDASAATYSEAGSFSLQLQDTTFANVDAADTTGDCTAAGRYFCSPTLDVGRFVPDHLALSAVTLTNRSDMGGGAGCSPASPFTYMNEPIRANFTLTAQNAANATTQNYTGALARLDLTVPANFDLGALDRYSASPARNIAQITQANPGVVTTSIAHGYTTGDTVYINGVQGMTQVNNIPYIVTVTDATHFSLGVDSSGYAPYVSGGFALKKAASGTDLSARLALASSSGSWTSGAAANIPLVFSFARALDGPFVPEFGIAPVDTDGVALTPYDMDISAPAGNDHASLGLSSIRLGRLKFSNAYGSELLDLSLPMEAQYWNGASHVRNTLDYCTSLANSGAGTSNFGLSNYRRGLASGETSLLPAATVTFAAGAANMRLSRPGAGNSGSVRVCADLDAVAGTGDTTCQALGVVANKPYLQGGAGFNLDPSADITFGTHKSGPVIYMREGY